MVNKDRLGKQLWERRIAPATGYRARPSGGTYDSELGLEFEADSGHLYLLTVIAGAEFEVRRVTRDGEVLGQYEDAVAWYHRPGHGWKEVCLSSKQEEDILYHFEEHVDHGLDGSDWEQ